VRESVCVREREIGRERETKKREGEFGRKKKLGAGRNYLSETGLTKTKP